MTPKECIMEAKPGYLRLLLATSLWRKRRNHILPERPAQHGAEILVLQRVGLRVVHAIPVGKAFEPQNVRKRHIGEVLKQ